MPRLCTIEVRTAEVNDNWVSSGQNIPSRISRVFITEFFHRLMSNDLKLLSNRRRTSRVHSSVGVRSPMGQLEVSKAAQETFATIFLERIVTKQCD